MFPSPQTDLTCKPLADILVALAFFRLRYDRGIQDFNAIMRPLIERVRTLAPELPDCKAADIFNDPSWKRVISVRLAGHGFTHPMLDAMMDQLAPFREDIGCGRSAMNWVERVLPVMAGPDERVAEGMGVAPQLRFRDASSMGSFCEYFYWRRAGYPASAALDSLRHPAGASRAKAHEALAEGHFRCARTDAERLTGILADAHHLLTKTWRAGDPAAARLSTEPAWMGRCVAAGEPLTLKLSYCMFMWYARKAMPANGQFLQPLRVPPYRPPQPAFGMPGLRAPSGEVGDPDAPGTASVALPLLLKQEHERIHAPDVKAALSGRGYAPCAREDIREADFFFARIQSFRNSAAVYALRREIQEGALRAVRTAGDGLVLCHLRGRSRKTGHVLVLDLHDTFPGLFDPLIGFIKADLSPRGANRFFFILLLMAMRYQADSVCFYAVPFG